MTAYRTSLIKRHRSTKVEVEQRRQDLYDIVSAAQPMTVRQVFYQATVRGIVEKAESGYAKLPVTFRDFHDYGIHWDLIAPSIRAAEALGFIRVTQWGVASAAEFHLSTLFALTHLPTDDGKTAATDDWRKIATLEEAKAIGKDARKAPAQHSRLPKRRRIKTEIHSGKPERTHSGKPERKPVNFHSGKPEHCVTPDSGALSISRGGGGGSGGGSGEQGSGV